VLVPGNPHLIDVKIDLRGIQSKGSVCIDPLNPLTTDFESRMGNRIPPMQHIRINLLFVE
jgi:hypothetical protein